MTDIFLDPLTNDIDLVNNVMRLTANTEELSRQRVQIWLGIFKGEWFFNIVAGIPYLANDNNPVQLLGVGTNKDAFDREIKEGINSFLLTGSFVLLLISTAVTYTPLDAFIAVFPWYLRYYIGGIQNVEEIIKFRKKEKKSKIYLEIVNMVTNH